MIRSAWPGPRRAQVLALDFGNALRLLGARIRGEGSLKKATYSNAVVITYSYDAAGNRTSVVTSGA
ncbi:hypothetical protein [uncultured Azohydromonas sp.]|uniref:hypothetical protein n=1 Tax=uncultured Azohydromonas sp. TaxID=487342 RepID=UPI00345B99A5